MLVPYVSILFSSCYSVQMKRDEEPAPIPDHCPGQALIRGNPASRHSGESPSINSQDHELIEWPESRSFVIPAPEPESRPLVIPRLDRGIQGIGSLRLFDFDCL